jgi:aryl-alcohol dehydrogenase-like predicted oxidoreductase
VVLRRAPPVPRPPPRRAQTPTRAPPQKKTKKNKTKQNSSKVTICTKISGPGSLPWIRDGPPSSDAENIRRALDGSLRRLGAAHVDLALLHWPDRWVPMFGARDYDPATASYAYCRFEEQLDALGEAVRAGKARAVGLSNETAWGVARCAALAEFSSSSSSYPRVAATQNAYSLLCRTPEVAGGVMEACDREGVALLAYAPLAAGHLTGKYLPKKKKKKSAQPPPPGPESRLVKYRGRYAEAEARYAFGKPGLEDATRAYVGLARERGLTPAALALRFVLSRPGRVVPSAVIGATDAAQLEELLDAASGGDGRGGTAAGLGGGCLEDGVGLPPEVLEVIDAIHERHPNPLP